MTPQPLMPARPADGPPQRAYGVVHVALAPGQQWRCVCWGRGLGTVVSRFEQMGTVFGYGVTFDGGDGREERLLPNEARPVFRMAGQA